MVRTGELTETKRSKAASVISFTSTMGLLLAIVVDAANEHDSKGTTKVIALLKGRFERLVKIVADSSYRVELIEKSKTAFGWILERWVVERTFAWFESYQRLSKDFEYITDRSEAMIKFAMIKLSNENK